MMCAPLHQDTRTGVRPAEVQNSSRFALIRHGRNLVLMQVLVLPITLAVVRSFSAEMHE